MMAMEQAKPASDHHARTHLQQAGGCPRQVAKATDQAKRDNKRVLLMFGGDWCGWCHKLHELFAANPEIRKTLGYDYVPVMIELESPNATDLLKTCKAALSSDELQKGVGYPFLAGARQRRKGSYGPAD